MAPGSNARHNMVEHVRQYRRSGIGTALFTRSAGRGPRDYNQHRRDRQETPCVGANIVELQVVGGEVALDRWAEP